VRPASTRTFNFFPIFLFAMLFALIFVQAANLVLGYMVAYSSQESFNACLTNQPLLDKRAIFLRMNHIDDGHCLPPNRDFAPVRLARTTPPLERSQPIVFEKISVSGALVPLPPSILKSLVLCQ
jgi:hypothetical protein